jgi:hypothetical protein
VLLLIAPVAQATPKAGSVRFARAAESSFDRFTRAPSGDQQAWMRDHYWRMRAYAPYFDERLSWYANAWAYQNAYAIYRGSDVAEQHPEWILEDGGGNKLYIPFGCTGGSCPQYAGDFGNPEFRAWWIENARARMAKGYRGLFVDDVNMDFRVGNGSGSFVAPRDPRTGSAMTEASWRRYMAEFTEQIRSSIPDKEIVHNAIWYAGCGSGASSCWSDPSIRRQLLAANYIELERGVNDSGITGGWGRWGYETFMARIDWLHSQGKGVIFDSHAEDAESREYGLASYLLVSSGNDAMGNDRGGTPEDWWPGYDVALGAPRGPRFQAGGLLRRDFERGYVLVNKPGGQRREVELEHGSTGPAGAPRSSVALGGGEGAVVVNPAHEAPPEPRDPTRTLVVPRPNPVRPAAPAAPRRVAPRRRRRLARAVLVKGRVKRAVRGRVRIRLQRKRGGRWVQVRSTRVAVRHGRFRKLYRGLPRGRYRLRAAYLGSATARMSASPARRFRIRR